MIPSLVLYYLSLHSMQSEFSFPHYSQRWFDESTQSSNCKGTGSTGLNTESNHIYKGFL